MNSSSCTGLNSAKLNNGVFIALTVAVTFLGQGMKSAKGSKSGL